MALRFPRFMLAVFAYCMLGVGCLSAASSEMHLRREGRTVSRDEAKAMTVSHGFYHAKWNTPGKGTPHRYDVQKLQSAIVVIDSSTGLMWQRDGSGPPLMDRQEAEAYTRSLNARRFGGFDDWRLPTLEEAMSLVTSPEDGRSGEAFYGTELRKGVYHISPMFEAAAAYFVWTTDLESSKRGWVVYFWDGICAAEEVGFHAYARAVRSMQ